MDDREKLMSLLRKGILLTKSVCRYTQMCQALIGQFKTFIGLMPELNIKKCVLIVDCRDSDDIPFIYHFSNTLAYTPAYSFMDQYDMNCPAAFKRLVEIGVPATIEHGSSLASSSGQSTNKVIAETVQFFITLMDTLKLNVTAVDEVHPLLSDLLQTLNKVLSMNEWHFSI